MISDNVVIMTRQELDERLEREFRRGAESALDDATELAERGQWKERGTGVVYSTDGRARIHVAMALDNGLGDCLSIRWKNEDGPPNHWYLCHMSPARARIIARMLIYRAALLEEANGKDAIDPIPEKMRLGPVLQTE